MLKPVNGILYSQSFGSWEQKGRWTKMIQYSSWKNSICLFQTCGESGKPWMNTILGCPRHRCWIFSCIPPKSRNHPPQAHLLDDPNL
eukprot:UN17240